MSKLSTIDYKSAIKGKSKIIYSITEEERDFLERERDIANDYSKHPEFDPLNPRANVFEDGRSMHILNLSFDGVIQESRIELFPKTLHFLSYRTGHDLAMLRRTYWHKLEPGRMIKLHHDNANGYFRRMKRYHVYLDVPLDFIIVIDGELWNVYDDNRLTNTLVDFNLLDWHYYQNNTDEPVYLLVADFDTQGKIL